MKIYYDTFPKKWNKPKGNSFPTGSRVYKGYQGSGKTLSMVKYAIDIQKQYPDCLIYSNVSIRGLENFTYIENDMILTEALERRHCRSCVLMLPSISYHFQYT